MPFFIVPIDPIRSFNCDRCGKDRPNKFLNVCPLCHLKFDDPCWEQHVDKEHKPRESKRALEY